jgi:hypothetical protein
MRDDFVTGNAGRPTPIPARSASRPLSAGQALVSDTDTARRGAGRVSAAVASTRFPPAETARRYRLVRGLTGLQLGALTVVEEDGPVCLHGIPFESLLAG